MIGSTRNALLGGLALAWAGLPVTAQQTTGIDSGAAMQQSMESMGTISQRSENGAVDAAPQRNDVSIVAGKDKSLAKISLTTNFSGGRLVGTLSTPVNMKDDTTQFFTLDGPVEDVQLGLGWKKQWYDTKRIEALSPKLDIPERVDRQDALCKQFNASPCNGDTDLERAMKAAGASRADIAKTLRRFNAVKLVGTEPSLFRLIPFHYLSFDGSAGRTERKFFDLPGAEKKDDRLSYSLSASYGRIFESSRATLSLTAQRKYKEADKARKCTPVAGSSLERCKELPLGQAAMVDSVPLAFEYRHLGALFAVSPKLVYDFKRHVAAASLPIYLFPDSTGKLTGGFRVDWEEHKRPVASVFVSSGLD